jgi:hypothetical protein
VKVNLITQVTNAYPQTFNTLYPFISYSAARVADFQRIDSEARASVQGIKDKTDSLMREMEERNKVAEGILADIQRVAAEQGVSQQAVYFQQASKEHETQATKWL